MKDGPREIWFRRRREGLLAWNPSRYYPVHWKGSVSTGLLLLVGLAMDRGIRALGWPHRDLIFWAGEGLLLVLFCFVTRGHYEDDTAD